MNPNSSSSSSSPPEAPFFPSVGGANSAATPPKAPPTTAAAAATVTTTLSSLHQATLATWGIDLKDPISRSVAKYDRLQAQLAGEPSITVSPQHHHGSNSSSSSGSGGTTRGYSLQERALVTEAWLALAAEAQSAFHEQARPWLRVMSSFVAQRAESNNVKADSPSVEPASSEGLPVSARQFAEALSELCFVAESFFFKAYRYVKCEFGWELGTVVAFALASPSRVLRLLGIQCARLFVACPEFLESWVAGHGPEWLGLCLDRQSAQETELCCGFMLRCAELRHRDPKVLSEMMFPQGLAQRVASMLDINDQLPSLTPSVRQQLVIVALRVLEAFPSQAAAADLPRILLQACCGKAGSSLSTEEMHHVVKALISLFDDPARRSYLRDADLHALLVPFVEQTSHDNRDSVTTDDEHVSRMQRASAAWIRLLTTWPGALWAASESMCLRAMVDLLHLPGPVDRKMVLLQLFHALISSVAPHRGIPSQTPYSAASSSNRRRAATQIPTPDFDVVDDVVDAHGATIPQGFEVYLLGDEFGDDEDLIPTTKSIGYYTGDPFCAALLLILYLHGLPQALITVAKRSGSPGGYDVEMAHEAAMLLQHIMVLMDRLLPPSTVAALHAGFTSAIAGLHQENRVLVTSLTTKLFQNLNLSSTSPAVATSSFSGNNSSGSPTSFASHPPASSTVALAMMETHLSAPLLMDDVAFQQSIKESHVEQFQEPSKWNFEVLLLLLQGPLRNPSRLRWARDNTRFFTRLLGFYKPSAARSFATLRKDECTEQVCGLGVALVELLLGGRDGAEMLDKAEFPKALRQMLHEIVDERTQPSILTWERIGPGASRAGQTLLTIVGRFTRSAHGLHLLKRAGVLDTVRDLMVKLGNTTSSTTSASLTSTATTTNTQQDLSFQVGHQLIQCLHLGSVPNYGVSEDIRGAVQVAMENHVANALRLCALTQLRRILWRDLATSLEWGIARLVHALSDPFFTIVDHSFRMLASICCSSSQALNFLISLRPEALLFNPTLMDNRKKWNVRALLYRIAGQPEGCKFLRDVGFLSTELDAWAATEAQAYAEEVERLAAAAAPGTAATPGAASPTSSSFSSLRNPSSAVHVRSDSDAVSGTPNAAGRSRHGTTAVVGRSRGVSFSASHGAQAPYFPVHFAAELCRTPAGCALLREHPLWRDAVDCILMDVVEDHDAPPLSPHTGTGTAAGNAASFYASVTAVADDVTTAAAAAGGSSRADRRDRDIEATPHPPRRCRAAVGVCDAADEGDYADELSFVAERNMRRRGVNQSGDAKNSKKVGGAPELISAARGYSCEALRPSEESARCTITVHGGAELVSRIKRSLYVLCNVGSSNTGFELLMQATPRSPGALVQKLMDLCEHCNHLSLRGTAMVCLAVLSRSSAAAALLSQRYQCAVIDLPSAYVSASGLPYSVAFAHPLQPTWMRVKRAAVHRGHAPRNAYRQSAADATAVPKDIADSIMALSNPVNREAAKLKLHAALKEAPNTFRDPNVKTLLIEVSSMYRLRSDERSFVAELLQRAAVAPSAAGGQKALDD